MKKYRNRDNSNALEWLSTPELDAILQEELKKDPVDQSAVKMVLEELRAREKELPVDGGKETGRAWIRYISRLDGDERSEKRKNNRVIKGVAAALVAVALLMMLPQDASAKGFFERLSRWTEDFFELFAPDAVNENQYEYIFVTDNPGLQKVYEAAVEMGVTGPAVPMWLPEGYELVDFKLIKTTKKMVCFAEFQTDGKSLIFQIDRYADDVQRKIYGENNFKLQTYEIQNVTHYIVKNTFENSVVWVKENFEFYISADCSENVLRDILFSIYALEG